ncbi:MAG: CotH kinase family protein [Pseudomonadota bacterium]|nr:CotH kinase family protein [Pseudomonadota bacterium]
MTLLLACVDTPAGPGVDTSGLGSPGGGDGVPAGGDEVPAGDDEASPDYAAVFGTDTIHHIALSMDKAEHAAMLDEMEVLIGTPFGGGGPPSEEAWEPLETSPAWYPAHVVVDDQAWEGVGIRLKGNSSLRAAWHAGIRKLPFRLDFDQLVSEGVGAEDQRLYGFEELSFANGFRDETLMRDVLASAILEDRGVPAARAAYWWVTLDAGAGPEPLGLYVAMELPDDTMVERVWGEREGPLYKPDGPCANLTCYDPASFEGKRGDTDGADIERLITALLASRDDAPAWREGLEATLDVDGFLRWLAVNSALQNWDVYGVIAHNYYLYGAAADGGRFTWIPWDHNEALADWPAANEDPLLSQIDEGWPLIRLLLDDPVYLERYELFLLEALEGAYAEEPFEARVHALAELLRPVLYGGEGEPADSTFLGSEEEFDAAVESGLIGFADERRAEVRAAVGL